MSNYICTLKNVSQNPLKCILIWNKFENPIKGDIEKKQFTVIKKN